MTEQVEVEVAIPTPLRIFVNNQKIVKILASNVEECIQTLVEDFKDLRNHIFDENSKIRSFVNVYLNENDIRDLEDQGLTTLKEGEKISIIPSIAGGI